VSTAVKENRNGLKLLCDYAHCSPRAEFRPRLRITDAEYLRRRARAQGWLATMSRVTPGLILDMCPEHAEVGRGR
jgi:hypothetical protein